MFIMRSERIFASLALASAVLAKPIAQLQPADQAGACSITTVYTTVYADIPSSTPPPIVASVKQKAETSIGYEAPYSTASPVLPSIASPVLPSVASSAVPVAPSSVHSVASSFGSSAYQPGPSAAPPSSGGGGSISVTPHGNYSSSVGVLGCKININRVAYWPGWPDCNNYCVKVKSNGREVNLLLVDHSEGAHDISYDAWNYLNTGKSASDHPTYGGGIDATWESVPNSECADLIYTPDKSLPLAAANSVNWYNSCPTGAASLYNIYTPQCDMGVDELCHMPPASEGNQPKCPSTLGVQTSCDLTIKNMEIPQGAPSS